MRVHAEWGQSDVESVSLGRRVPSVRTKNRWLKCAGSDPMGSTSSMRPNRCKQAGFGVDPGLSDLSSVTGGSTREATRGNGRERQHGGEGGAIFVELGAMKNVGVVLSND